jgi:hypothetical protein
MAEQTEVLIDLYVSDQWRIHGGPRRKSAREELRDRFLPVVIKAFGSVEFCLDLLLKESPCSNGHRIGTLIRACELFFLRKTREATEGGDEARAQSLAEVGKQFHALYVTERKLSGTSAPKSEQIRAILRTDVCRLPWSGTVSAPTILSGTALATAEVPSRRGRRPSEERRRTIQKEIMKHGDGWREHLPDIFEELDRQEIPLGDFLGKKIDVGGTRAAVSKWEDLDLAQGNERSQIVDALRKYRPRRT